MASWPGEILGIHFSYDGKGNNELNFNQKIRRLQTKLDYGVLDYDIIRKKNDTKKLRSITISVLGFKSRSPSGNPGFSTETKGFKFISRNKKDKIKRSGLYQDPDTGGIRMPDINIMFKALKLAWIPRLMNSVKRNWCTIPNHSFKKIGSLNFLLRCNYDTKYLND